MDHSTVYVVLVGLGMVGNVMWMLVNFRVQGRVARFESTIGAKIDALKDWMSTRYMSTIEWDGLRLLYDERHADLCRRVVALEKRA